MPITPRLAVSRPLMEDVALLLAHSTGEKLDAHPSRMTHVELTKAVRVLVDSQKAAGFAPTVTGAADRDLVAAVDAKPAAKKATSKKKANAATVKDAA